MNRILYPHYAASKTWEVFGHKIKYERRSKDSPMGRFGGGWNWKIGVQWGSSTIIFNLLVAMVRIDKVKK